MVMPKPSEARVVVTHHEDGRMKVTLNGETIPGVIGAAVVQEGRDRAVLQLSIIGHLSDGDLAHDDQRGKTTHRDRGRRPLIDQGG